MFLRGGGCGGCRGEGGPGPRTLTQTKTKNWGKNARTVSPTWTTHRCSWRMEAERRTRRRRTEAERRTRTTRTEAERTTRTTRTEAERRTRSEEQWSEEPWTP